MRFGSRTARAAACIILSLTAQHSVVAQTTTPLTALDFIEIQQLVNKLNYALDYCTNGGRDFAELFVEGGQYSIDRGDGKPTVFNTREQLVRVAGGPDCEAVKLAPRSHVRHLSESLVVDAAPNGARGKSYAVYPADKGQFLQPDVAGQVGFYHDEYVKTPNGWRFKSRVHELSPPVG